MDNTALTAHAQTLTPVLNARANKHQKAAQAAALNVNRLVLAQVFLSADLPREAVVEMTDWADEPNGDGTYDVDPGEAYLPESNESLGDLGGQGAVSAGHYDGMGEPVGTDWDLFLTDDTVEPGEMPLLSVAKVYDWLASQQA